MKEKKIKKLLKKKKELENKRHELWTKLEQLEARVPLEKRFIDGLAEAEEIDKHNKKLLIRLFGRQKSHWTDRSQMTINYSNVEKFIPDLYNEIHHAQEEAERVQEDIDIINIALRN